MGSPITLGALSTTAPPSETRSARRHTSPEDRAAVDDRSLIDAVRAGNLHAYDTLYERHVGAVRGLARRLCGNQSDADDVVGDVFTNTLRAIKSGRGPRDDLRPYVLTATRHTVIKLRTRHDSGRAFPTPAEQLDRPVSDDSLFRCTEDDTIASAFGQLPDRFRNVLWLSCVEDLPPVEVGRHTDLSVGAVSSLTLRARRALARTYLISRISQPIVSGDCVTTRELLPSIVRKEATAGTVARVDRHLVTCCECREAFDEMHELAGSLRAYPWLAATLAWLRSLAGRVVPEAFGGLGGAAGLAPVVVAAVAVLTFTAGDAPIPTTPSPSHVVAPRPVVPTPVAAPLATVPTSRQPVTGAATLVVNRSATVPPATIDEPALTAELREGGVPTPAVPIAGNTVGGIAELVGDAITTPPEMVGMAEPVDALVGRSVDIVDQFGQQVVSTTDVLAGTTGQLLESIDQTVVDVLETAGADQLAVAVGPVLETATDVVATSAVEPVAVLVTDTVERTTTLVTQPTSALLGLTARH